MSSNNKPVAIDGTRILLATVGSDLTLVEAGSIAGANVSSTPPTDILSILSYDSVSGEWEPSTPSNVETGLTIWASPVVGQLGTLSANDTLIKAQANNYSTSDVYGVYTGTGTAQVGDVAPVMMESGLTINGGDMIYLSTTQSGAATNVEPTAAGTVIVELGIVQSTTGYNAGSGSALPVLLRPSIIGELV